VHGHFRRRGELTAAHSDPLAFLQLERERVARLLDVLVLEPRHRRDVAVHRPLTVHVTIQHARERQQSDDDRDRSRHHEQEPLLPTRCTQLAGGTASHQSRLRLLRLL
jgi:hypothetical protein